MRLLQRGDYTEFIDDLSDFWDNASEKQSGKMKRLKRLLRSVLVLLSLAIIALVLVRNRDQSSMVYRPSVRREPSVVIVSVYPRRNFAIHNFCRSAMETYAREWKYGMYYKLGESAAVRY